MAAKDVYRQNYRKDEDFSVNRSRFITGWVFLIIMGAIMPFLGIPVAILMKDNEDRRYVSLLIISLITGSIYLYIFIRYGFVADSDNFIPMF